MATKKETEATKEVKETKTDSEQMVRIRLPLSKTETEDVYVSINDKTWLIKRGVTVEVPVCVAKQLEHQERMLLKSYEFIEANKK